jgi:methyl-accepting chemotaxis protein PixJ
MSPTFSQGSDANKNTSYYKSNQEELLVDWARENDASVSKKEQSRIITINSAAEFQQPVDTKTQWSYLLTDFSQCLYQCSTETKIFEFTVKETRKLLSCDRVVIYSLNDQAHGLVVAESVGTGWTKALGKVIYDPCFEARYIEKYSNGRIKALDDIYLAGLTPCYIEQLEKLEVKANLVAPIIKGDKLLGLLVAHQCSAPRTWQQIEASSIAQIALQVGDRLDRIKLLADYQSLQQQTEKEKQWTNYFTDAIQYIRASLNQEEILKATVREVRRVLNCDRVVVYSTDNKKRGTIVAESVAPGWTRALGKVIDDPCFEAKYLEEYRNGRVRALENIYVAGMTPCYIEQLEKLEVKANLVAPIINEGKLFGLLVAHQCDEPRAWQHYEVRWVAQLATQVGFALDNASLLASSDRVQQASQDEAQWGHYFTAAIQNIRASLDREDILEVTTEEVRSLLKCDRVVVYSMNSESHGGIIAESVAPGWMRTKGMTIQDPCFEARYMDKYRNGRVRALENIREAGMTSCYIEQLETIQVKANLVTPIVSEGKLFGLLVAHQCSAPRAWQQSEIAWIAQIATQVGFALDNASLLVSSQKVQQQVENEAQLTKYFTEAIQHIRASLDRDDILEVAADEARRVLNCDRVVVYSLDRESNGTIVAESVAPGWTRGLGRVIQDPCFKARYMDKYRNGRVMATDNIYQAGMTPCYIEQLEVLEVKANLVAPIIGEGKLFGLFVAHQCSASRAWRQSEISWMAQLSNQIGFALDNASLLKKLAQYRENESVTPDRDRGQIQAQISNLLANSRIAFENLSVGAVNQSAAISNTLSQIQGIANFVKEIVDSTQDVNIQVRLAGQTIQSENSSLRQAKDIVSDIQQTIVQAASKIENLHKSSQELSKKIKLFEDIATQITHDSLNVLTAPTGNSEHEQIIEFTKGVISLMQKLTEVTSSTKTMIANIETETNKTTDLMDIGAKNAAIGVELVQQTQQKFKQIETTIDQMQFLTKKVSQAGIDRIQTSNSVSQSVQEVANLTQQISKQSLTVIDYFDQLQEFTRRL